MAAEEFSTQIVLFGIEGIDLKRSVDLIKPTRLARMTNVARWEEGSLQGRMGIEQIRALAAHTDMHSVIRIDWIDGAGVAQHSYVGGADANYFWGDDAALAVVAGFPPFTNPGGAILSFMLLDVPGTVVPGRPPHVYTAPTTDTGTRIKVRANDGLATLISPQAPLLADIPTYALAAANTTAIDNCDVAGWTNNAGSGGAPANAADAVIKKEGAASLHLTTAPGAAPANYYNYWNKANALNLNLVGALAASDDDIIHLWIRTDRPDLVTEFRVYFVVNAAFDVNTVPGTSATLNTDAYMKAFRPSDFTPSNEVVASTIPTASTAVSTGSTLGSLQGVSDERTGVAAVVEQQEASRRDSVELGGGRGSWQEVGIIGFPLRRGDFARIGTDSSRTWANVVGFVLVAQINTNAVAQIWLDDIYLTGGVGPDTSPLGFTSYDFRYTNVDSRTGEESNPTRVSSILDPAISQPIDALRRGIAVTPVAAGNANYVQRFYRRGGSLPNNWYFDGDNVADGGVYTSIASDLALSASSTLAIDNDVCPQITSIWGPLNGIVFGCGILTRRGEIVWSKVDQPSAWPAAYTYVVCSDSEELMSGFMAGGQSWAFSRERLFSVIPDLSNAALMQVVPTQCKKGLVQKEAFAVYQGGVFFGYKDGIYFSPGPGGAEKNISDDTILSLFRGDRKYGYQPIDWAISPIMRLEIHENELWLTFKGVGTEGDPAATQVWIYNTLYNYWRHHLYGVSISAIRAYTGFTSGQGSRLLIGTAATATLGFITSDEANQYTKDFSTQMPDVHIRTGALDQGLPRVDKLYGDAYIDVDDKVHGGIVVTPYVNNESQALTPTTLVPAGTGRERFYIPIDEVLARNISLDISWIPLDGTAVDRPVIYQGGISYTPQADTSEGRVTNWDTQGRLNDKWVKGVLMEVDTVGIAKSVNILADGAVQTNISVQATGRQVLQFSFAQFRGRILRLQPTDTVRWKLYDFRWIFDEEPLALLRWESQEIDHGFHGQQVLLFGHISIRSTTNVTLTLQAFRQDGTSTTKTYTITSTAGAKVKKLVLFEAQRGILFKYLFTAAAQFWLYREESTVRVQPWGQADPIEMAPFGDDDLNVPVRGMMDAGIAAARSGAGNR